MCCFSQPVEHVAQTRILARPTSAGRQLVIYAMDLAAVGELAMILPLPVAQGCGEHDVELVDLESYPSFFEDLVRAFPPAVRFQGLTRSGGDDSGIELPRLEVKRVGRYDASFAPTAGDLSRLDPRFRIDPEVWDAFGDVYAGAGFAVFKLRSLPEPHRRGFFRRRLEARRASVHPMAFTFPSAHPHRLFFPTAHVHDGEVHSTAHFDHTLYAQVAAGDDRPGRPARLTTCGQLLSWTQSTGALRDHVDAERGRGLLDFDAPCFQTTRLGTLPNRDHHVGSEPVIDDALLARLAHRLDADAASSVLADLRALEVPPYLDRGELAVAMLKKWAGGTSWRRVVDTPERELNPLRGSMWNPREVAAGSTLRDDPDGLASARLADHADMLAWLDATAAR